MSGWARGMAAALLLHSPLDPAHLHADGAILENGEPKHLCGRLWGVRAGGVGAARGASARNPGKPLHTLCAPWSRPSRECRWRTSLSCPRAQMGSKLQKKKYYLSQVAGSGGITAGPPPPRSVSDVCAALPEPLTRTVCHNPRPAHGVPHRGIPALLSSG